jgi:hypothetical protein
LQLTEDFRWARRRPWLWGVVFGCLMAALWLALSFTWSNPDSTVKRLSLAISFGVLMGLGQFLAITWRNRKRQRQRTEVEPVGLRSSVD